MYPWQGVTQRDTLWSQNGSGPGADPPLTTSGRHRPTQMTSKPLQWPWTALTHWKRTGAPIRASDCNFSSFPPACRMRCDARDSFTIDQTGPEKSLINCAGTELSSPDFHQDHRKSAARPAANTARNGPISVEVAMWPVGTAAWDALLRVRGT